MSVAGQVSSLMIDYIKENFSPGIILELGSGAGTQPLIEAGFTIWAVEHSEKWLNKFNNVTYFYAPLKEMKIVKRFNHSQWYDKEVIATIPHSYQLIIVDGPPGTVGRSGFLKYMSLFNTNVPIIIDDINRPDDLKLAGKVSARLQRELRIRPWGSDKWWGII